MRNKARKLLLWVAATMLIAAPVRAEEPSSATGETLAIELDSFDQRAQDLFAEFEQALLALNRGLNAGETPDFSERLLIGALEDSIADVESLGKDLSQKLVGPTWTSLPAPTRATLHDVASETRSWAASTGTQLKPFTEKKTIGPVRKKLLQDVTQSIGRFRDKLVTLSAVFRQAGDTLAMQTIRQYEEKFLELTRSDHYTQQAAQRAVAGRPAKPSSEPSSPLNLPRTSDGGAARAAD